MSGSGLAITVHVPTWKRPVELVRCLAALDAQVRRPDEVVVTVRRDDPATLAALEERPHGPAPVRVVQLAEQGVVASMNAGMDAARGDVLCIIDDDTMPHTDWLARIEAHYLADPELGGVGGRDHWFEDGRYLGGAAPGPVGKVQWFGRVIARHHLGAGPCQEVDLLKGANMSFRRAALDGVRIDSRLRGKPTEVHTELDLCLALQRRGWRLLYDPGVEVDHYLGRRQPGDGRYAVSKVRDGAHNETYALIKWLPWWRKPVAFLYGLLVGTRFAPGPVAALEQVLHGRHPAHVWRALVSALRGRMLSIRTFIAYRRATRDDIRVPRGTSGHGRMLQ